MTRGVNLRTDDTTAGVPNRRCDTVFFLRRIHRRNRPASSKGGNLVSLSQQLNVLQRSVRHPYRRSNLATDERNLAALPVVDGVLLLQVRELHAKLYALVTAPRPLKRGQPTRRLARLEEPRVERARLVPQPARILDLRRGAAEHHAVEPLAHVRQREVQQGVALARASPAAVDADVRVAAKEACLRTDLWTDLHTHPSQCASAHAPRIASISSTPFSIPSASSRLRTSSS